MSEQYHRRAIRRRRNERGSALLIVFVFAAVIAIMLYREMPVAAFEARRQKEQTLVDRGHEYQRAVQLYYRKFRGRYPANIEMLENTNNVRFLRRRYTDPFTGKDDWRLLHAGPGGQLIDSKVKRLNPFAGPNGANPANGPGLGSGFGTGARNGFGTQSANQAANSADTGSSAFGSNSADTASDSDVTVTPVAKRAAPVAANAPGGASGSTPTGSELDQDPSTPLLPTASQSQEAQDTGTRPPGMAAAAAAAAGANQQPGNGANSMQMVQNLFNSGAGQPQAQTTAASLAGGGRLGSTIGSTGNIMGGAFAGVASKAKGLSIKKVEDQTDYSLWEFWYDPTKDTSMGTTSNLQNGAGGQNLQPSTPGFGSPGVSPSIAPGAGFRTTDQSSQDTTSGTNPPANPAPPQPAQPAQEPQ
jgi:hypothetical protein